MKALNIFQIAIAVAMTAAGVIGAQAQAVYPNKAVRLIVPFAAGGGNDTLARLYGQKLTEALGQSFVVDNKPGAGTTIATAQVARSTPDGYTLLLSSIASHAVSPNLYKNPGYDPIKDFSPVAMLGIAPVIMGVNLNLPVKSVSEFIKLAKAQPGRFKYASGGAGSVMHTSAMVFSQSAGVEMLHVPYRGAGPAYIALLSNEVDLAIDTTAALSSNIKAGKVRALAIARNTRMPEFPDVPTFAEAGLPGYEANGWYSIHAPAGTPPDVIAKLNREIVRISNMPDVQEKLRQLGTEVTQNNTPENLTQFVRTELAKYTKIIKAAGIEPE